MVAFTRLSNPKHKYTPIIPGDIIIHYLSRTVPYCATILPHSTSKKMGCQKHQLLMVHPWITRHRYGAGDAFAHYWQVTDPMFFFGMVDLIILDLGLCQVLPSGKRLHNYGKLPSLIGKITINVFFFNSDIGLPESILDQWVEVQGNHCKRRPRCLFDAMAMATWINADKSHGTWISSVYSLINFQCLLELRGNVEMLQEINCTRVLPPDLSG